MQDTGCKIRKWCKRQLIFFFSFNENDHILWDQSGILDHYCQPSPQHFNYKNIGHFIKIFYIMTHISISSTLLQVLAEEDHSLGSRDWVHPPKKKTKTPKITFPEDFSFPPSGTGVLTSISAFHLIRLQKPAVYSAAVTKKCWEMEPGSQGSYLQKINSNLTRKQTWRSEENFRGLFIGTVEFD